MSVSLDDNHPAVLLQDNRLFRYSKLCETANDATDSVRSVRDELLLWEFVEPPSRLVNFSFEKPTGILRILGLLVLEEHLIAHDAENLYLALFMGHGIAEPLADPVQHIPCLIDNPIALCQGNLEMVLHPFDGTALENIVGIDPDAHQVPLQVGQGLRCIIDPPEQDSLVIDDNA